MDTTNQTFF